MTTHALKAQLCTRYIHPGQALRGTISILSSEEIEWAAAQIHGHVWVNNDEHTIPIVTDRTARLSIDENAFPHMDNLPDITTFNTSRPGSCIYSSKPHVIVSESKTDTCAFALALPERLCPSFHGKSAGVFYIVTITAKIQNYPVASVHLPFEVLGQTYFFSKEKNPVPKTTELRKQTSSSQDTFPIAVRLGIEPPISIREESLHGRYTSELYGKSQISVFTIGKQDQHLVRLILYKQFYYPGDVILGTFDFSQSVLPCFQISSCLQLQEISGKNALTPDKVHQTDIKGTHHMYTMNSTKSNVYLRIPATCIGTLETDMLTFQWQIVFEFVTTAGFNKKDHVQVFQWSIPIQVLPYGPVNEQHFDISAKYYNGPKKEVLF